MNYLKMFDSFASRSNDEYIIYNSYPNKKNKDVFGTNYVEMLTTR